MRAPTAADSGALRAGPSTGRTRPERGAGFAAVIAVLAPVLAGTAALIFLLVGYILKMLEPRSRPSPSTAASPRAGSSGP